MSALAGHGDRLLFIPSLRGANAENGLRSTQFPCDDRGFLKRGYLEIIHFRSGFSILMKASSYWGSPISRHVHLPELFSSSGTHRVGFREEARAY